MVTRNLSARSRQWASLGAAVLLILAFATSELNLYRLDVDRAAANHQLIQRNTAILNGDKVLLDRVTKNEQAQCVFEHRVYARQELLDRTITASVHLTLADQRRLGLTDSEFKAANAALEARNQAFAREQQAFLSTLVSPVC